MPNSVIQEEAEKCWICLLESTDEDEQATNDDWRHPCKCNLVAHEHCLLEWIGPERAGLPCPQCGLFIEAAGSKNYFLRSRRNVENTLASYAGMLVGVEAVNVLLRSVYDLLYRQGAWSIMLTCSFEQARGILRPAALQEVERMVLTKQVPQFMLPEGWKSWYDMSVLANGNVNVRNIITPTDVIHELRRVVLVPTIPLSLCLSRSSSRFADGWLAFTALLTADSPATPGSAGFSIWGLVGMRIVHRHLQRGILDRIKAKWEREAAQNGVVLNVDEARNNNEELPAENNQQQQQQQIEQVADRQGGVAIFLPLDRLNSNTVMKFGGALMLPVLSSATSRLLSYIFPKFRTHVPDAFTRNAITSCLVVLVKDLVNLYTVYLRCKPKPRKILNYDPHKQEQLTQSR
ncbi:hypothetical protein V1514DRAFT_327899 [Lipomyces japonicus]|uniref:uncharacterized protein n=1 Tax=Lipomyces japonicus TaxID=56871 RepID=UPI0034CF01A5